ncbi:hypothetical protein EJ04DRAFT_437693 [Polyplosphaeria fusca]|uniref:RNA polymerase III RPC4 n=1 Tax=Polyplosphaeria fusca TaxID=682080 RepID=A0A9P4UZD8_9PLEO|nr:hypothetical protein EJ04DRAFT_437693 [Polyplosphaeria fusca]
MPPKEGTTPSGTPDQNPSATSSATPPVRRTAGARGKKPAPKPTFTGRRSKEERDAWLKEERQKDLARKSNVVTDSSQKEKKGKDRDDRKAKNEPQAVSGPFSMGAATRDNNPTPRVYSSASRATRVKSEREDDGNKTAPRPTKRGMKQEDGGTISSDEEGETQYPRYDINDMEKAVVVLSDEETTAETKTRVKGTNRNAQSMLMPVRLQRAPHRERGIDINTESSTARPVIKQPPAEVDDTLANAESSEQASRKGAKDKLRDVEITEVRKPYKGMWQDTDDANVNVKNEPLSEDETVTPSEIGGTAPLSLKAAGKQRNLSPDDEKKPKMRHKSGTTEFQTDYDRQEHERHEQSLEWMKKHLGSPRTSAQDIQGDVTMDGTDDTPSAVRDGRLYLFQFPPRMANLDTLDIKKEQSNPELPNTQAADNAQSGAIVMKEDPNDETSALPSTFLPNSGLAGRIRVHKSGRVSLDWGGTSFELNQGLESMNVQEAVTVSITPETQRVVKDEGGDGVSFGRLQGKFVVTPDLTKMLGLPRD